MTFQEKRRFRSVVALVVLAFAASGTVLQEALGWSFQSKTARRPSLPTSSCSDDDSMTAERLHQTLSSPSSRRSVLLTASWALLLGETAAAAGKPIRANAADDETATTTPAAPFVYTRKQTVLNKKELNYQISIPSSMNEGSKPVKTHLDEVNFVSESVKRYQYGITVDPVRISSLKEFGTPEEVAARVVTAEVNRDGIFEVTLLEDPYQSKSDDVDAYILKYLSVGKRGRKVYTNKIVVSPNNLLYVLTAQCKEDDFSDREAEIKSTVESFRTY